jgi:methylmalonyl-CoA mutase N-terminal domain/subunit
VERLTHEIADHAWKLIEEVEEPNGKPAADQNLELKKQLHESKHADMMIL